MVKMTTVAIPVFRSRVAPVFESCTRALLIAIEQGREKERVEIVLRNFSLPERISTIKKVGVHELICAAISEVTHSALENLGVHVVAGIAGDVDEVIAAFITDQLDQDRFRMPGRVRPGAGEAR